MADRLLEVRGLTAGYGGRPVVFDVDLDVAAGEVLTILGSNGAGKTTLLEAIVGLNRPLSGTIHVSGRHWDPRRPHRAPAAGMAMIPAERFTFGGLTVAENLDLGSRVARDPAERARHRRRALDLFPRLAERRDQLAGTMSGGEQRMLSLAVALSGGPSLLLLDEPSLGLAPAVAESISATLARLARDDGLGVVMVEQNVHQALAVADRVTVLRSGRTILDDTVDAVRGRVDWWSLY